MGTVIQEEKAEKGLKLKMTAKEKFYKIFANLPLGLRSEIVAIIDGQPVSWLVAKMEIDNDTQTGKKILNNLETLKII